MLRTSRIACDFCVCLSPALYSILVSLLESRFLFGSTLTALTQMAELPLWQGVALAARSARRAQPRTVRARRPAAACLCGRRTASCCTVGGSEARGRTRREPGARRTPRLMPNQHINDPYAGSPTKTLLRLLLPRSDQVRLTFRSRRDARRRRVPLAVREPH